MFRQAFSLVAAIALLAVPACAANTSNAADDSASDSEDLSTASLKDRTVLRGTVAEGSEVTLAYSPDLYPEDHVPYIAVELANAEVPADVTGGVHTQSGDLGTTPGQLNVSVDGNFPGSPRVIVVDERFHVLARSTPSTSVDGNAHANVVVPETPGKKLILVHDAKWVLPMNFQLNASRVAPVAAQP